VAPLDPITHRNTSFQPLPRPLGLPPYHLDLKDDFAPIAVDAASKMVLHVVGDSGGVQDGEFQGNVAHLMLKHLEAGGAGKPQFCYHVGDVVYFTGAPADYYSQFYEPYSHYDIPIFAIPGNHDGEVDDPKAQTSLDGWVDYFMQPHPDVDPISKDCPRIGLSLPNPYWTLLTPKATFVGMYTNVPEHGSIDSVQQQWVTNEFATAPEDRALILALHHPIYSFDGYHSGSARMADVLENAIRDTGRIPNLVLSGHVHNFQHLEQVIVKGDTEDENIVVPFIVCGNGGYHNLHTISTADERKRDPTGSKLVYGAEVWGFMTLTIDGDKISGVSTEVDRNNTVKENAHTFECTTAVLRVPNGKTVNSL
jgi:hypothetical protein